MSETQDKLRRLANLRGPKSHKTTRHNVADFDEQGEHISAATPDFDADFDANPASIFDPDHEPTLEQKITAQVKAARASQDTTRSLHDLVPGYEIVNDAGLCYCTVQSFPLEESRGPNALGNLLNVQPALFHRYHPTFGLGEMADYRRAAFIDTETTGLGGGAGVYCFMVGVGTFEAYQPYAPDQLPVDPDPNATPTHFVVRQFFMRNPAEEGAQLVALADLLANYEMTVTFNGRSFDLPLLRLRYTQNRRFLPLNRDAALLRADRPHLDLLMPARKVWKRRLQSCRLINLEQMILGLHRSEEDVPGYLIPELYQQYVHTGLADALNRVFYHNQEDIVTMVALADHLSSAFSDVASQTHTPSPQPTSQPTTNYAPVVTGMDWAGLGRVHDRAGDFTQAEAAYTRALESVRNPSERAEIYRALGELYKRQALWKQATDAWQTWITSVSGNDPTPYVELAKYCEWETRDLEQAEMWTSWALHTLQKAPAAARKPGDLRDLQHRLARIQRKRAPRKEHLTSA